MRLLITGASGRIGRALAVRLARDHAVRGFDRVPSSTAHWVGDLGDPDLLKRALQGVDAVVHTAALQAPQVGPVDDAEFERINLQASHTLAELAEAAGVRHRVYTRTTALYGAAASPPDQADPASGVDEDLAPPPRNVYHRSKLAAEAVQQGWALPAGIDRVVSPARAMQQLGWQPHHGFDEVLRQLDEHSPEVLPPGFEVALPADPQPTGCRAACA